MTISHSLAARDGAGKYNNAEYKEKKTQPAGGESRRAAHKQVQIVLWAEKYDVCCASPQTMAFVYATRASANALAILIP